MPAAIQKNTFSKEERLCSRKEIDRLFENGISAVSSPLRLLYIERNELPDVPAKTMFVVPKRSFRKAHDRNRLRRRMREAFRQNKHALYELLRQNGKNLSIALLYNSKKEKEYSSIEQATGKLLQHLCGLL